MLASSSTTSTVWDPSATRRTGGRLLDLRFVARGVVLEVEPAPDRMSFRHFDEHDPNAVRIFDPHLPQAPRHGGGRRHDLDLARRHQAGVLVVDVGHLEPERHRHGVAPSWRTGAVELEEPASEE